jgi:hypothetical protein
MRACYRTMRFSHVRTLWVRRGQGRIGVDSASASRFIAPYSDITNKAMVPKVIILLGQFGRATAL